MTGKFRADDAVRLASDTVLKEQAGHGLGCCTPIRTSAVRSAW